MWNFFWMLMFMLIPIWIPVSAAVFGAIYDAFRVRRSQPEAAGAVALVRRSAGRLKAETEAA